MYTKKLWFVIGLVVIASMVLTSCAPQATPQVVKETVIVAGTPQVVEKVITPTPAPAAPKPAGPKILRWGEFGVGDVPTIDPALATDTSSNQIVLQTFVGLTHQNEVTTQLEPGMASKWEYDAAKHAYTFHLLTNVPWVKYDAKSGKVVKVQDDNGKDRMVTAGDFQYGILRTLDPKTAGQYAYVLTTVIVGAADFNSGKITDTAKVGIKVIDDATLEVDLTPDACVACAASILGLWTSMAQPQWQIDARADRWTEPGFFQSYGPFTLKEWIHDSTMTIIKNPFWPGTDAVPQAKIDEVVFSMLDTAPALAEYEAGNADESPVPLADIDRVKADPTLSKELSIAPSLCTYYYGFKVQVPPTDDRRVRFALSEAIDRQGLIDNVTKGGQEPAQWFARPGLGAAPTMKDHPDLGVKYNPDDAKKVLQSYLDEKKITADKLQIILVYNTNEGHQKIAEAIAQMWKEKLGITVQVTNQEWKVFLQSIIPPKANMNVFRLGWCQDYPDANNFDKEVFNSKSGQNNTNWSNADYDKITDQAAAETDPAKRLDLYAQAEDILVNKDAAIAPIYWYTTIQLTKPYVTRTHSVLGGLEDFNKWDIKQ
jgi:oligopeptide transport system substrate-binding protein